MALRYILDHATDLQAMDPTETPRWRRVAETLIESGLRRSLSAHAPGSLARRIANWRTFHNRKGFPSPFEPASVKRALKAARRASRRPHARKSARPVTSKDLDALLAATGSGYAGLRDRALLETGWSSGGRRRSELAALRMEDLDLSRFDAEVVIGLTLPTTKTHQDGPAPRLVLRGRPARALVAAVSRRGV